MLREKVKIFGVSLGVHAVGAVLLTTLAAQRIMDDGPDAIEIEVIAPPPSIPRPEPRSEPEPEPEPEPPKPIPTIPRPRAVPERVRMAKVAEPRPFQDRAPEVDGAREAPDPAEAVPTPTAPVVLDMEATVGSGTTDYVTTSASGGSVAVRGGPGGGVGGDGRGRGAPGGLANQDAADVAVARDWQITRMPAPLNDGDFEPLYPPVAKREGREAAVVVRLYIDPEGRVSRAVVVGGPREFGFAEAALDYARKLRFEPARAGTRKVASRIEWTVYFYVRNG